MDQEELFERKKLQRRRIRGLLIVVNLTLLIILVYDVVNMVKNWW